MNSDTIEGECSSSSVPVNVDNDAGQNNATSNDANQKQTQAQQTPTQSASSSSSTESAPKPVQTNLQRIKQQKQDIYNWPKNKKLLKLAMYSSCQVLCFCLTFLIEYAI